MGELLVGGFSPQESRQVLAHVGFLLRLFLSAFGIHFTVPVPIVSARPLLAHFRRPLGSAWEKPLQVYWFGPTAPPDPRLETGVGVFTDPHEFFEI